MCMQIYIILWVRTPCKKTYNLPNIRPDRSIFRRGMMYNQGKGSLEQRKTCLIYEVIFILFIYLFIHINYQSARAGHVWQPLQTRKVRIQKLKWENDVFQDISISKIRNWTIMSAN